MKGLELAQEAEPVMVVLDDQLVTKVLRGEEALAEQARQDEEQQEAQKRNLAHSALQEVMG